MQASVTTVFRSATPASSIPICSASRPARGARRRRSRPAPASDICSPVGLSLLPWCSHSPQPSAPGAVVLEAASILSRRLESSATPADASKPWATACIPDGSAVGSVCDTRAIRGQIEALRKVSASSPCAASWTSTPPPIWRRGWSRHWRAGSGSISRPRRVRVHRLDRDRPDRARLAAARRQGDGDGQLASPRQRPGAAGAGDHRPQRLDLDSRERDEGLAELRG